VLHIYIYIYDISNLRVNFEGFIALGIEWQLVTCEPFDFVGTVFNNDYKN